MLTTSAKVLTSLSQVADRVTSLLKLRKSASPIFNRPRNTNACPHHRRARILYAIFLSISLFAAIPVVALKALTYSFINLNQTRGFTFQTTENNGKPGFDVVLAALPETLQQIPANMALVVAVISISLTLTHLSFVICDWKSGKRTQSYAFRRNIMFLHITNSILVLFTLLSIYVTHKNTSHFRDGYVNFRASHMNEFDLAENSISYDIGRFDLEIWACELKDVRGASIVKDDYSAQCYIGIVGRVFMIPLVITASVLAGIGIWGLVGGGRRGPDGVRMKTEDIGLELGKMENAS